MVVLEVFGRIAEIDGRLNVFMVWRGGRAPNCNWLLEGSSQGQPNYAVRPFFGWGVGKKGRPMGTRTKEAKQSKAFPLPLRLPVLLAKACQWPGDNQQEKGE